MKIIVGLGNIGSDYDNTRHNTGFMMVDYLARQYGGRFEENKKFRSLIAQIRINNQKVILVKPTTFYNLSGFAVQLIVDYYKIDYKQDLLVIQDDLATDFGMIRVRQMGSAGGNNGIRSIINQFGAKFWRIKIGTNNAKSKLMPATDFVLSKFSQAEEKTLKQLIKHTSILIEDFTKDNLSNSSLRLKPKEAVKIETN